MKRLGWLIAILAWLAPVAALGQGAVLQGGPWALGHAPMYAGGSAGQPFIQDSGAASGAPTLGVGLSELLLTVRNPSGVYPAIAAGSGPLGANLCDYDAPINNPTGYHYICLSPNPGQLIFGAGGAASPLPFSFNINGTTITLPSGGGSFATVVLPTTTGAPVCFGGTTGGLIACPGITNAQLATVPAATFKGNPTASPNVAPTDFTIAGLPARGAPDATNDKLVVLNNATGAFNYVTPGLIASSATAGVSSVCSLTGALTATQVTACLNLFSSSLQGLVPSSGGGTSTFLRADGTFAIPYVLPPGVPANVLNSQTSSYSVATTDCGKTIQAGTGSSGLFTITLPSVSGFAVTCVVQVINGDTGREKLLSGFPSSVLPTLWPGQTVQVSIINGAWVSTINPGKWRPSSAVTFNVTTTGTDAAGCALGAGGTACATGQYAMNLMCQNIDPSLLPSSGTQLTIQYATGAYTQTINSFCDPGPLPWVGSAQSGWLKIAGNTNLTSVTLACGSTICFSPVHSTAGWWIEGFATSGTSTSVVADSGSHIYLGINSYGTTGGSACDLDAAYGSLLEQETNFTSAGTKNCFGAVNQTGSRLIFRAVTLGINSTAYTTFFIAGPGGQITAPNLSFATNFGVGTNGCWNVSNGGGLETDGAQATLTTACSGAGHVTTSPGWAN